AAHAYSALHGRGDYLDDGTPEGDDETDPSEADVTDEPGSQPTPTGPAHAGSATTSEIPIRRAGSEAELAQYGHGATPRRRRSDEWADRRDAAPQPRRRRGWIAATFIFALLFAGSAALDWYLWNTADQWEHRAEM